MKPIEYLDELGTFRADDAGRASYLYFPIANEAGVLASVTPTLGGDSKLNQNAFLLQPVSAENLHDNRSSRNFWLYDKDAGRAWSATGVSARQLAARFTPGEEAASVTAGMLWHRVTRQSGEAGLRAEVTSFAPVGGDRMELMRVVVTNLSRAAKTLVPTAAIPMYGRSADNIRDHRHVTSLLGRAAVTANGVVLTPTLTFDERGHKPNTLAYGVLGADGRGRAPVGCFPVAERFIGEGGSYEWPEAVVRDLPPTHRAGDRADGWETAGALRFADISLQPGESAEYIVGMGYGADARELAEAFARYGDSRKCADALAQNARFWAARVNVRYHTANPDFDRWMRWVSFQPTLRSLYGCSFLPHHDYGRGGRGWRDLWQDCLALLVMNPDGVRETLRNNFGGVRFDGSNATIIGSAPGEFIADRNNIARVWMDHGVWPFLTTKLYIDQSGDLDFLTQPCPYFKDPQAARGELRDEAWTPLQGSRLLDASGAEYHGTVLEHLLVQHLTAFYDVGEHNHIRLRGADWNDALDMAKERGESVAFTCQYGDNLDQLAALTEALCRRRGLRALPLAEELLPLLADDAALYDSVERKQALLLRYGRSCLHAVSGRRADVPADALADGLRRKAAWVRAHVRATERVTDGQGRRWFNSYYDNHGRQVEGGDRMMLTGQVFAILSGVAEDAQTREIVEAADRYLYDEAVGGYRLNTDFHELKTDMGRMFGFAYGTKENGAVFSHMAVMYAYALYRRGFAKEGYRALGTLAAHCMDFAASRIYPGVPEYIAPDGRGLYGYLTGSASWLLLTMVTQAFGAEGLLGDLRLAPRLTAAQFDTAGEAALCLTFAGRRLRVRYLNPDRLDAGEYRVARAELDGAPCPLADGGALIARATLLALNENAEHTIAVTLARCEE